MNPEQDDPRQPCDKETEQSIYSCNNFANCKFKLLGTSNYGCSYGKYCDFKVPRGCQPCSSCGCPTYLVGEDGKPICWECNNE